MHTIQRWIYFRKILLIFEFSRVSKPFFTEQFSKCQRNLFVLKFQINVIFVIQGVPAKIIRQISLETYIQSNTYWLFSKRRTLKPILQVVVLIHMWRWQLTGSGCVDTLRIVPWKRVLKRGKIQKLAVSYGNRSNAVLCAL